MGTIKNQLNDLHEGQKHIEKELSIERERNRALRSENDSLGLEKKRLVSELDTVREQLPKLQEEITLLRKRVDELEKERDRLMAETMKAQNLALADIAGTKIIEMGVKAPEDSIDSIIESNKS
jgi:chromosome segregation ATPase